MKIVKVTYKTKLDYSEQNQNNIKNVMTDLQGLNIRASIIMLAYPVITKPSFIQPFLSQTKTRRF